MLNYPLHYTYWPCSNRHSWLRFNYHELRYLIALQPVLKHQRIYVTDKFYNKANGAAGTRVRKAMQDLKLLAADIRKEITEKKNQDNS